MNLCIVHTRKKRGLIHEYESRQVGLQVIIDHTELLKYSFSLHYKHCQDQNKMISDLNNFNFVIIR